MPVTVTAKGQVEGWVHSGSKSTEQVRMLVTASWLGSRER